MKWLYRHLNDKYVKKTDEDGYRSRSAYKLIEIDNKFKLFQKGQRVVDLGASPGGWSQIAFKKKTNVVAIDIKPLNPIPQVKYIQCDVNEFEILKNKLKDQKFDVILSDMAPESCGLKSLDHIRIILLCEVALNLAKHFLNYNGKFVVKIFHGKYEKNFFNELKKFFKKVKYFKPKSSRSESNEMYLIGLAFKGDKYIK
ncbi:MAG: RlmE family RNA methyltransferase [Wolbachia endosymbiont of Meromenopon meropis]|nr:RlmE family RNA methyltransferase [Wolbachia endosymbiont of Meromenopon meropis]